jgi:hypothetical protein
VLLATPKRRRNSESKVSRRGAARLPVLFNPRLNSDVPSRLPATPVPKEFQLPDGGVTPLPNDRACRAIEPTAHSAIRRYSVLANAHAGMNANKNTCYDKAPAWAFFICVLSKCVLCQQRESHALPEHSGGAGPPGPKHRVELRATGTIAESILAGFVIEEIGAKDRVMKPGTLPVFPRPHHAADGAFCRAERAFLIPMLRWSSRGLDRT